MIIIQPVNLKKLKVIWLTIVLTKLSIINSIKLLEIEVLSAIFSTDKSFLRMGCGNLLIYNYLLSKFIQFIDSFKNKLEGINSYFFLNCSLPKFAFILEYLLSIKVPNWGMSTKIHPKFFKLESSDFVIFAPNYNWFS